MIILSNFVAFIISDSNFLEPLGLFQISEFSYESDSQRYKSQYHRSLVHTKAKNYILVLRKGKISLCP